MLNNFHFRESDQISQNIDFRESDGRFYLNVGNNTISCSLQDVEVNLMITALIGIYTKSKLEGAL